MDLTVVTSNASADFLTPPGVPPWDERKALYARALAEARAHLIGFQEVTPRQIDYLRAHLPGFRPLTVPVVDPDPAAAAAWAEKYARFGLPAIPSPYEIALFYRDEAFDLLDSGHWWLSPTPARPSIGFGNVAPRAVLWVALRHRAAGRALVVFNTHLDHRCVRPMVDLCRERFGRIRDRAPVQLFIGDLNLNPATAEYRDLLDDGWRDAHAAAGNAADATFLYDLPGIPGGRIDHVLYRGAGLVASAWATLRSPDPARRVSDHDPVCARLVWASGGTDGLRSRRGGASRE